MAPEAKRPGSSPSTGRPRYEAPVLVPLGGLAKGAAACSVGSTVTGQGIGYCKNGNGVRGYCATGNGR